MTQQVRQTETSATTKATASPTISSSVLLPPALAYAHGRLQAMYGETREYGRPNLRVTLFLLVSSCALPARSLRAGAAGSAALTFRSAFLARARAAPSASGFDPAAESYRELRLEPLCCPHRLSRGTAPHEREYPQRKDRF
jgi:hypothetical protein